jgi:hypothetical protein
MILTNFLIALFSGTYVAAAPLDLCLEASEPPTDFIWSTTHITYTITVIPTSSPAIRIAAQQTKQAVYSLSDAGVFERHISRHLSSFSLDSSPTAVPAPGQDQGLYSVQTASPTNYGYSGPCSESNACKGDLTFYDTARDASSPSACGVTNNGETDFVLALPQGIMTTGDCGRTVHIDYEGQKYTGVVVDKCMGCDDKSIDVSKALFRKFSPLEKGRLFGAKWYIE